MRDGTNVATIVHQFGGAVNVIPVMDVTPTKTDGGFQIEYRTVPSDICVKLASSAAVQFDRVLVNGQEVKALGGELDPAVIATNCNANPTTPMIFQSK